MGVFLATIDGSIVNISLPTLVSSFQTDFALVQWVVLAYLLTVTTLMLGVGRLADIYGKKPIYTTGFIVFTVGSVLCGLSPTIYNLIGFRVLQAVGAAMIMALGMAITTEAFPPSERGRALGISGTIVSVGIAVGPTLGGLIVKNLSWHWIFFVNLPVGIIGTWMVVRYVPAFKPPGGQRFDYPGALTLFASLLSLLLALTLGQRNGFGDRTVLLLAGAWIFFLVTFIFIELRTDQPMIDLRLFRSSLFSVSLATGLIIFICLAGTLILMPFYAENVLVRARSRWRGWPCWRLDSWRSVRWMRRRPRSATCCVSCLSGSAWACSNLRTTAPLWAPRRATGSGLPPVCWP
jgi:EmrB/QacA subfamily drug resistance transporter